MIFCVFGRDFRYRIRISRLHLRANYPTIYLARRGNTLRLKMSQIEHAAALLRGAMATELDPNTKDLVSGDRVTQSAISVRTHPANRKVGRVF